MRLGLPDTRGHRRLLAALSVDALGTGLFLPFSLLFFTATTPLRLPQVGLALSVAAVVRIPATAVAGMLTDRFGARSAVIGSNLLQFLGFTGYLFVTSVPHLLLAAVAVQIGNSAFWVAYPALVHDVARSGAQEPWFALITGLRNAGLALGGLGASVAVAAGGGAAGYRLIVGVNAVSFLLVAALMAGRRGRPVPAGPAAREPGWSGVLRDRAFLAFVGLNVGFVLLSMAFILAVPVFLTRDAGLPSWVPGIVLALNAILGALGATPVVRLITGRQRGAVLMVSQVVAAGGYACILAVAYTGNGLAFGAVLLGVLMFTFTELSQGPTVSAIVNEAAGAADRGRYISVYQMTFSVVDIVAPALLTALLARGPLAIWVPLVVLAAGNAVVLPALARRLPALRRPVGHPETDPAGVRVTDGDGL
jgi:MFS family permease